VAGKKKERETLTGLLRVFAVTGKKRVPRRPPGGGSVQKEPRTEEREEGSRVEPDRAEVQNKRLKNPQREAKNPRKTTSD